jgi:hypothetical protein
MLFKNNGQIIAQHQIALGKKIIKENIEKEKLLSPINDDNQHLFCVAIDAAWNSVPGDPIALTPVTILRWETVAGWLLPCTIYVKVMYKV